MSAALDLTLSPLELTAAVCDIHSVSLAEAELCDAVEVALRSLPHLQVTRYGNTVVARTELGRPERVILAGHLDTVPLTDPPNLPTMVADGELVGRGTVDMKGGVAVQLALAARLVEPVRDITYIFYEAEEIASIHNGLRKLQEEHPHELAADFAVLLEPTNGQIEGGCNGTLRVKLTAHGQAAHSARPWQGSNAIHAVAPVLSVLAGYQPRDAQVDGLTYRESLNAVGIAGGIATNVIPDRATVTVNFRYAPDRSESDAVDYVRTLFPGLELEVEDNAGGARPGLDTPAAAAFVEALGLTAVAKLGWTDVARFSSLGVPAVNFGPGDPSLAHRDDERCPVGQYADCFDALRRWLEPDGGEQ